MKRGRLVLISAAAAAALTCGDPTPPTPGWLSIEFVSPRSDDGGIRFEVSGGRISAIRSTADNIEFQVSADSSTWQVVVAGTIVSGVVAEILVPDVHATGYVVAVREVASRTYTQRALSGYDISIKPAPL